MTPGAFRASAPDIDIPAMERDLSRIPAVGSARVVLDEEDQLREVHVVCGVGRSPKLVGRDVQSLLAARWGIDVDHRKVSVVQVEGDGADAVSEAGAKDRRVAPVPTPAEASPAATIESVVSPGSTKSQSAVELRSVAMTLTGERAEATVEVTAGDQGTTARAVGLGSWSSQRRLVVTATFDALATLDARLADVTVGEVVVIQAAGQDVVVATLNIWRNGAETAVAGAAAVGSRGELHAAAAAIVDAVADIR
jgi:hypothetical protein